MALKIKSTDQTEVYVSEGGYICVKQVGHMGEDDSVVTLSPDQARMVAEELTRLAAELGPDWGRVLDVD